MVNVVTVTFEYPPIPVTGVNDFAPFGAVASAINEVNIIIFPDIGALPTIPSPNNI